MVTEKYDLITDMITTSEKKLNQKTLKRKIMEWVNKLNQVSEKELLLRAIDRQQNIKESLYLLLLQLL